MSNDEIKILKEREDFVKPEVPFASFDETPVYDRRFFPSLSTRSSVTLQKTLIASPTVTTVNTTATETNLATIVIPSNEFGLKPNGTFKITAFGVYSTANGVDTVTVRVGIGNAATTELNSMTSTAASVTNAPWHLIWCGTIASLGSSGTIESHMTASMNNVSKDDPNTATATINTTLTRIFAVTAQWSNALAGNTISIRQFIVERVY